MTGVQTCALPISATHDIPLRGELTEEQIRYLSEPGNPICLGEQELTIQSFNRDTSILTVEESITYVMGTPLYTDDAGAFTEDYRQYDVHATLVFGADAYGVIDIDGSGTMETIIKPHGSEGSGDPLNQRATVGAKVAAYAATVLNPLWIVRIEHTVSK